MASVLVVEDDQKIARSIARYLEIEGFGVNLVADGNEAVTAIQQRVPDLVVLDLMLPGLDGIEICAAVRPEYTGAILMLTASDDETDELMALKTGIDDFVSKPVRLPVLLARINALLRRVTRSDSPERVYAGDLCLEKARRTVTRDGIELPLSETEFEVMWTLAKRRGEIVTREELFESVLGREYDGLDRSIDMKISSLRKKLGDTQIPPRYIRSLRSRGYLLL
jgi:DNA-binding response OmpR family regulator